MCLRVLIAHLLLATAVISAPIAFAGGASALDHLTVQPQSIGLTSAYVISTTAQLNVTVTSASADTVWIELSASGLDTEHCRIPQDYCAGRLEADYHVTPCALAAQAYYYSLCSGSGETTGDFVSSRKLALKPGVTYTVWGGFAHYGNSFDIVDQCCCNQACLYIERTPDLVYTPVLTATTPITWGAVKAMYRSP